MNKAVGSSWLHSADHYVAHTAANDSFFRRLFHLAHQVLSHGFIHKCRRSVFQNYYIGANPANC